MEKETKNFIENFIGKLCADKIRLCSFILGFISALCAICYLATVNTGGVMLFYMLTLIMFSVSNVFLTADIDEKFKYSADIFVCGIALVLLGFILRIIQLGIIFSWKYFIAYVVFSLVFIMMLTKYADGNGKTKIIKILLAIMAAYSIFMIFYTSSQSAYYRFSFSYYRFAEAFLFIDCILIMKMHDSEFDAIKEKLGNYKHQIPSLKISIIIITFIAVISFAIGFLTTIGNNKATGTVSVDTAETVKSESVAPTATNKATGTVSDNSNSSVSGNATTTNKETAEITIGQTVTTKDYEFTLNSVEFSYRVQPENPPSYYTYYDAPNNQVYIYLNADIKNTSKYSLECDEIYSVTADYNGGYTYNGSHIADDTDGDFTYANITSVDPLQTNGVHCLIACPEEVETAKAPLFLTITMKDGSKYKYTIR